jgi:hypothetical protein
MALTVAVGVGGVAAHEFGTRCDAKPHPRPRPLSRAARRPGCPGHGARRRDRSAPFAAGATSDPIGGSVAALDPPVLLRRPGPDHRCAWRRPVRGGAVALWPCWAALAADAGLTDSGAGISMVAAISSRGIMRRRGCQPRRRGPHPSRLKVWQAVVTAW